MPYGQDPPVEGAGSGYGRDPAQSGASNQPPATTPARTTTAPAQVPFNEVQPDPAAAVAHGLIGVPVEAGRMLNEWGAKPLGWDLSHLVPESMQRGWDVLTRRANQGGGTAIGESIGSALPFLATGGTSALPWLGRVLTRSALPAALQPTTGPVSPGEKAAQTIIGTALGEGLQGLGWLASTPLGRWAVQQARGIATSNRAARDAARDQLQRTLEGRSMQIAEVASRQAARDAEEQGRERTFKAAQAEYERTAKAAAEVEARNRARQQVVDRLNQRNTLDYAGRQAGAAADEVKRLDMPRQATQSVLNDARGLIGLRPLEYNLTRESAPQALREVGQELDRLYGQMSFDPNQGGWLRSAARIQADIRARLRQDPRAQALWEQVFQDKAFMPGLRAEAGAGAPVMGVAPGVVRPPVGTGPGFAQRSLPTGEVQGPLGTRSGPIAGDQLSRMMSVLTRAQQKFGLEAQQGGGALYRDMADGLRQMRQSIERQLDARFPKLAEQRQLANQAYFLTSRVMDAVDVHGVATPEALLKAFKSAEGDTRFGTDKRYADIKDRLEQQHRDFTTPPDKPTAPVPIKGLDEPVPKVSKEPSPPDPLPPIQPVPLKVPPRRGAAPRPSTPDERLPPGTAQLAGEAAGHLGHLTGIPGAAPASRGLVRALTHYGKPALRPVLRTTRDVARGAATPAAIAASQGVAGVAEMNERRRQRRRQSERNP